ncbi:MULTISPECIES: gluconate 2-dehydrogenase subunit 3 family protein [Pseudoalteromonas]|uniref:Twin-arginine translocation pathway signal n=1 Tax=Pseudoalteromonas amylolytica TaxID=1859457 RepID=A0A1S1MZK7_9GAMM|nr:MULTISPECIES: gluconate 2-dehydrogenase subunit 3 family protein [Pseudoalteromonas]OHU90557.1 hypothetical protein BFC16_02825 [Pseudoalteromonas sp. JW3]OHU92821.1 hypothetical protein BET10_05070 [Pseudoalteromonas amylolytica]
MMLEQHDQSKRRFLQGLLASLGAGITTGLMSEKAIAAALTYHSHASKAPYQNQVLNKGQLKLLKVVCNTVIPTTDTPGAGDIDVHYFIDNQLQHCYDVQTHVRMRTTVNLIAQMSQTFHNRTFEHLQSPQQIALLTSLDTGLKPFSKTQQACFKQLKALICFGYYTSEIGASEELVYQAYPGGFEGDITYSGQRNYGSLAYY